MVDSWIDNLWSKLLELYPLLPGQEILSDQIRLVLRQGLFYTVFKAKTNDTNVPLLVATLFCTKGTPSNATKIILSLLL